MLWVAGYKPYLVFKIVDGAVNDLKAEQTLRMEEVKVETVKKEKELTETLARLQESVVALPMLALARQVGRLMDGEIFSLDLAVEALNTTMLQVIEGANSLRKSTESKVVEILSPIQIVNFWPQLLSFIFKREGGDCKGTRKEQ